MKAVREQDSPATSGSIDVQFSDASLPAARGEPPARRPRPKTIPGMIGESITHLPVVKEVMPKSRRGRVLVRSVIVAFALVASWIAVIVYLQLRAGEKPDFRPLVEAILVDLRDGKAKEVYDASSSRFQEMVLEDTFLGQVQEMNEILGPFREIASVHKTETFYGPSGRTARVSYLLDFERGRAGGSMSFHREDGTWRLIGYHVDLPENLAAEATTIEKRLERLKPPKEIEDVLRARTEEILSLSREGKAGAIWDDAHEIFQQSISREDFIALEQERHHTLGPWSRILQVTQMKITPNQTGASVEALLEYRHPNVGSLTVAATFKYTKVGGVWKMTFYKVIPPQPRGETRE